jgi:hypothetical protein
LLEQGAQQCRDYLATGGPFPERRHITALIAAVAADFLLLVERWSLLATAEVERWPDVRNAGLTPGARQLFEQVVAVIEASPSPQEPAAPPSLPVPSQHTARRRSARR